MAHASAEPFIPSDDGTVLERLPDTSRALRRQQAVLATDPRNLALALPVADADIGRARAMGDPRYLGRAEAALTPWPAGPAAPASVMLLRAVILQSNHDFQASLAALARVLRQQPGNAQAWLTRASIRQAQADYPGALADCGQVATLVLGLAPDVCTAGAMALRGQAPLALRAITLSLSVNAQEAARSPAVALWALTLAAEIADRLDDPSAELRFKQALAVDSSDPYLLGVWSDWLLDHGRPGEVVALLADKTRIDPLLLRLALAERALGEAASAGHVADLAARFEASRLRGDTVHRREEARFALSLLNDPGGAVALARANWTVQREPADARILLEAAIAAGQPEAAEPALDWLVANHVQDKRLAALAARLRAKS
jgi:tetratricopeptide (TPR) repeat protein